DLTSDQELLRDTTARFIETACPVDRVRELAESDAGVERDYLRQAGELGWFAMLVPEEHGGGTVSGNGVLDAAVVAEERGRFLQPGPFVAMNAVAWALAAGGTDEQQSKVLPALASGDSLATWALADLSGEWRPDGGVRASRTGGGFLLRGAKGLVQDAHLADWVLVTAATDGGMSQFLVRPTAPGVSVHRLDGLDITRRLCEVRFDDVELPESALVGEMDGAADLVERQLQVAVVLTVAESVGAMDRDFEVVVDYAKARTAFGRPIGSFQAVKHLLADTALLLEASKSMAVAAAHSVQEEREDAPEVASMAKAFIGDSGIDLAQNCLQVFGGIGYTWEHDHHLYLRRLTADASLFGEPAWHRERICRLFEL
ncbi:MAG TPA: acyl-CoA dehydrogenase family protein, partial [Acidimicrobiales bacterium]|nr:acyl-CoA dehydrogenase family protein [Acidimicrobiales bacterium]